MPGLAARRPSIDLVGALRLVCLAAGVVLLAVLCWILLAASASVLRARQRQRELLSLLAHGDPKVPGALVVDHPAAAAYCLPGLRSAIVISAGTLDLLDADELAAVLAHERAHLRERHDLVLLPFLALLRAFRWAGRRPAGLPGRRRCSSRCTPTTGPSGSGRPGNWPPRCCGSGRLAAAGSRRARWPSPSRAERRGRARVIRLLRPAG